MDFFWQITIVELLLNIAVFAGAVILYGPVRNAAARCVEHRALSEGAAVGTLFGLATAAALLLPVHFEGGAAVGCQTVLLALSAPIGGWTAGAFALMLTLLAEALPWTGGADSVHALSALASVGSGVLLTVLPSPPSSPRRAGVSYLMMPLLGALSAVGGAIAVWIVAGPEAAQAAWLPALVTSVPAASMLGTLLLHEQRRDRAERGLRDSQSRLLLQARELANARDSAEAANRAKSAFLANMSHELRTPLNAILGHAQMLRQRTGTDAQCTSAAGTISACGEHLLQLINDLLDLSKIEARKFELAVEDVDLENLLGGVRDMVRIRAQEKGIELVLRLDPELPRHLRADGRRLRQILLNLLGNAVKFTDAGSVTLSVDNLSEARSRVRLRFEVHDTGIGIPPDQLERIFHPFEQAGSTRQRAGGSGLGLSISRQLVRLMSGDLKADSRPDEGSRFWFELSLDKPEGRSERVQTAAKPEAAEQPLLSPPLEHLETLHALALTGNMRRIQEEAARIATLDHRYGPFSERLQTMAQGYQSRAILQFIEAQLPGTGDSSS